MELLKGYPLRKITVKEQIVLWILSPIVLQQVMVFLLAFIRGAMAPGETMSPEALMDLALRGSALGMIVSLPILALVLVWRKIPLINRKQVWSILPGISKEDWKFLLWYIPVSFIVHRLGVGLLAVLLEPEGLNNQQNVEAIAGNFPVVLSFLMIVIAAPIVEEWIFRGVVMFRHKDNEPTWVATIISAVLFGGMHMIGDVTFFSAFNYIGMGLLFAYAAKRTKSVESAILYHFLNNALAFYVLMSL
jgi:membrane protease YdiL (CAAX protease family)